MRRQSPADELAEVRAEIARLKMREAALEAAIQRNPHLGTRGTFHAAEVTETRQAVFDPALLPPDVQQDPRYWREQVAKVVAVIPIRARPVPLRPGWPIRRATETAVPLH
jgi:hypothetical protein